MKIIPAPSPNFNERPAGGAIDILLMHYTGMKTGAEAIARLCDPTAKVSSHYVVEENGDVFALVPEEKRAWHAGHSYWAGETDINSCSIGIEIVNPGHEFGYRDFPGAQITAVEELSRAILARHGIQPSRVIGHSDVAPARKEDPGERFPWEQLARAGIGLWPDVAAKQARYNDAGDVLMRIGYEKPESTEELRSVLTAFQRHWVPRAIGTPRQGVAESETLAVMNAVAEAIGKSGPTS